MTVPATAGAELPPRAGVGNAAARFLAAGADRDPAVIVGREVTAYAVLRERVGAAASVLQGIAPGERIGLLGDNGVDLVVAYLACLHRGLCAVPLPTSIEPRMLRRIAAETGMGSLLVADRLADDVAVQQAAGDGIDVRRLSELQETRGASGEPRGGGEQLAALLYTSGSTGAPKGVMVSHRNLIANAVDIVAYMELDAGDRVMLVLPLHYCYGLSVLHSHLAVGASVVINNGFMFPERVLDDLDAQRCTGFAGVPSHYQILVRKTRFTQRRFPALRWLQQAGGRLPTPFVRELRAALPDVRLYLMYGQTEATARLSYLPPERLDDKEGSIGRGLPSTRLEVLDPDGAPIRPGSHEIGEIVATGPGIAAGYWGDPAETARYFNGGRLRTGDLATIDADGFIFVVDRSRDFIKSMGTRVSSREIEEVICAVAGVVEAAVVGVPDELWGEAIVAFVVAATGEVDGATIAAHCNRELPNAKVPARIEIVDTLPRNDAGKVLKARLRERATADGS